MPRWLPWLVVCALALYVVSPSLTRPRSADKDDKDGEKPDRVT